MIKVIIVADSLNPQGDRLTSLLVTFPRIILAEINTHRMLSKNTSSSRAIPFNKMVEAVQNNPFIPIAWQKGHKGMQGSEYITDKQYLADIENSWLLARDKAIEEATYLHNKGVTKQLCNRLLEPFMWTTMLITGSKEGWDNFFSLRNPEYHLENIPTTNEDLSLNSKTLTLVGKSKKELLKQINEIDNDSYTGFKTIINNYSDSDWLQLNKGQAEIHIMDLAEKIYDAMNESIPRQLGTNEWHIPFEDKIPFVGNLVTDVDINNTHWLDYDTQNKVKISTALAARTSYTIVGDEKELNYQKMIELHDRLIAQNPPHSSPMEHCARAMSDKEYISYFRGELPKENLELTYTGRHGWCRNYKGFIQYRHIVESEMTN